MILKSMGIALALMSAFGVSQNKIQNISPVISLSFGRNYPKTKQIIQQAKRKRARQKGGMMKRYKYAVFLRHPGTKRCSARNN